MTRTRTGTGAWITAALLAGAAIIAPAAARATAGSTAAYTTSPPATPSPTGSPTPCPAIQPPSGQNTPPTAPGAPEAVQVVMTLVRLRWAPATDADGIACYQVREVRNGAEYVVGTFGGTVTEGSVYLPWPPGSTRSEVHQLYVVAVDTKGAAGPASGSTSVTVYNDVVYPPSPSPSPSPARVTCRVAVDSSSWWSGMTTSITITNTAETAVNGWRLTFAFPDPGQKVTNGWSATWSQSGTEVTAVNLDWNKTIAPGRSVTIGFLGSHTGANPSPATYSLNGASCAR
ncbi:cellulose binding domain-containing protein [Microbispora sp. NBC_01389]|uniref:cellulose binding domain-containing protein n=1 Tax=Microbispora sp. NBC_01389 TaxID=2903584 RepID=UPI003255BA5C